MAGIYIAPLTKALLMLCIPKHTPTVMVCLGCHGCHARYQPAHQEQLGSRCLAQGVPCHTQSGIEPANLQLPDDCSTY